MRLLHFTDIHVDTDLAAVPLRNWLNKRAIGGLHLAIGRGKLFRDVEQKLEALTAFALARSVDLVVFSGDYTALGLEAEFARAARVVEPLMQFPAGYVHVPGNHDLYVKRVERERRFEHHFPGSLASDLPERATDGPWPLVRLAGDDVAVVAVNSARANLPWKSTGAVPQRQLDGLAEILRDPRLAGRFVFIVTHYAPRLADGSPDRPLHRMDNAEEFLACVAPVERGAILCGHVHHRYHVKLPGVGPGIFCGGSATMVGREGAWLFDVGAGATARATPVGWTGVEYLADTAGSFDA